MATTCTGNGGSFDSCPTATLAGFNRGSYGGESGSSHSKGGIAWAVLSSGNSGFTQAARLSPTKFGHVSTIVKAVRPAQPDLVPLTVSAANTARDKTADSEPFSSTFTTTRQQRFSGRLDFDVYLSTNRTISRFDHRLGGYYANTNLASFRTTRLSWGLTGPTVRTVPPGQYYIGMIVTTRDANGGNQATPPDHVWPIRVWEGGDFVVNGSGCKGSKGPPQLRGYHRLGRPVLNDWSEYRLSSARPSSAAVLLFGGSNKAWGPHKLPLDMSFLGMSSCFLRNDILVMFGIATDARGEGSYRIHHHSGNAAVGSSSFFQYLVLDPGSNQLGLVMSNGLRSIIGSRF